MKRLMAASCLGILLLGSPFLFAESFGSQKAGKMDPSKAVPGLKKRELQLPKEAEGPVSTIEYTQPGVVTFRDGKWVGSPHLFQIPKNIPILIEVTQFVQQGIEVSEQELRKKVAQIFEQVGLTSQDRPLQQEMLPKREAGLVPSRMDKSPAFFSVQLIVYPVEKGYVVGMTGRLLESFALSRVQLPKGVFFQAISWEKSLMALVEPQDAAEQISRHVETIATAFVNDYKFYDEDA